MVRGVGLLMGMKAKVPNTDLITAMREHGLLVAGAGENVLRLVPPLIVSEEDVREIRNRMVAALDDVNDHLKQD